METKLSGTNPSVSCPGVSSHSCEMGIRTTGLPHWSRGKPVYKASSILWQIKQMVAVTTIDLFFTPLRSALDLTGGKGRKPQRDILLSHQCLSRHNFGGPRGSGTRTRFDLSSLETKDPGREHHTEIMTGSERQEGACPRGWT